MADRRPIPDDWQSPGDLGLRCGTCANWGDAQTNGYHECRAITRDDPDNFGLAKGAILTKDDFSCTYWIGSANHG